MSEEEFKLMSARDPDGQEKEPTEADYEAFEEWAARTFGKTTYNRYMSGSWAGEE